IIDGYRYRLSGNSNIEIVAVMTYAEELEPSLAAHPTDVLLLDVNVPTAADNPNPYPILYTIPKLLDQYAGLSILVITMHNERHLAKSVMEAGASGYILKDDQEVIRNLDNAILSIAKGGIILSQQTHQLLLNHDLASNNEHLTGRQLEALSLCAAYPDWTTADFANKMAVTNSTIRNLFSSAYLRLGVHTRLAAVTKARELGIITPFSPSSVTHQ
ncbi:MAG TPA: response regulator transcription factor, partial [Anaerolineales bacterium]|nr:response regulator transcription factor [Anaerolineales bacterium]